MKADFLTFGMDRTGGLLCMLRYLRALSADGHEVTISSLGRAGDPRFVEPPADVAITYVGLRGKPYKGLVRVVPGGLGFPTREISRLAAARPGGDLSIASYALAVAAAQRRGGPVYAHVQHFDPLIVPPGRAERVARSTYAADIYRTANCTWVADRTAEVGGTVQAVITPGIDLDTFTPGDASPVSESARVRIITLGKSVAWKGLVDVVAAARVLGAERDVDLVSYGPDKPAGQFGRARLEHHGFVDGPTLARLYRSSSVCVSASWYESFPLPPLEAMACGVPVICTRLGTEDYAEHEVNCLIVAPKDPEAIAAAVRRITDDGALRSELIANGLATAPRFTWDRAERAFVEHARRAAAG
jgi:glycosyltransferase involved in cell wall biosynthesis